MIRTLTAAALAAVLALSACGDDEDEPTAGGSAGAATTAAAGGGADPAAFPATVRHKFGETRLEEAPERVVVAGYTELDAVLALGVTPVGTRAFLGGYDWKTRPWARGVAQGEEPVVIGEEEINFEAVAAQRPDVILALNTGMDRSDYQRLSKIAPTIAQSGDVVDFGMSWQDQTMLIAQALGRQAKAREVIREVEAKFAQAREEHPEFARATAILAYGGPDGYGAYTTQDTRSRFLEELGFQPAKEIDEIAGDAFYTELSKERFRLIDRDLVVMYGPQEDIESDAVFKRLDAVEEDRVVYMDLGDHFAGALGYSSPLSLPYLLERAVPVLAAAADGDPATKVEQPT